MKKFISLALVVSALAMQVAFAEDAVPSNLIPAETMDEMIANNDLSSVDSSVNSADANADVNALAHRPVVCYASNSHGHIFTGRGHNAFDAQRRALDKCNYISHGPCYARGCN